MMPYHDDLSLMAKSESRITLNVYSQMKIRMYQGVCGFYSINQTLVRLKLGFDLK